MEFCAEMGLCVGNTYFEHKSLHKDTRVARDQDRVEVKSMIDMMLIKKDKLHYMQNMRAMKGMGTEIDTLGLLRVRE